MQTNVVTEYDYYTLEQARKIINTENRQRAIKEQKIRQRKIALLKYYMKQKLIGLVAIMLGIYTVMVDTDATVAVCLIPLGLYLMFTRKKVIMMK